MAPPVGKARLQKTAYGKIVTHDEVADKVKANLIGGFWFERCGEGDLPSSRTSSAFARNKEYGKLCIAFTMQPNPATPCDPLLVGVESEEEDEVLATPDLHFFIFPSAIMLQLPNGKQMPIVRPHPQTQTVMNCDTLEFLVVTEILHESGNDAADKAFKIQLPIHLYQPKRSPDYFPCFTAIAEKLPDISSDQHKKLAAMMTAQNVNGSRTRTATAEFDWETQWTTENFILESPM